MEIGSIVEYIDRQKIMCAVILEIKKLRLRLLTESNREIKLSANRLSHKCQSYLDLSLGRDKLVESLKQISGRRKSLIDHVDVKELWEVLNTEQEWIDLETMTEFCFPENPTDDHESAVIRAFFENRRYFKFNGDRFFPHTEDQVIQLDCRDKEKERINRLIETSGKWLKDIGAGKSAAKQNTLDENEQQILDILKSFYLLGKEGEDYQLGKQILKAADIDVGNRLFALLVKFGIWDKDENLDLIKHEVPTRFSDTVKDSAEELVKRAYYSNTETTYGGKRKNLTDLPLITIDGQATLDFDDALSIEKKDGCYRLGIHISDVGQFIKKDTIIDLEAGHRASSIYMPDRKIPMIPSSLAEGLCSLKAAELRPAISILISIDKAAEIVDFDIVASLIKVQRQLSYYDVNTVADEDEEIQLLFDIAKKFRHKRLAQGALQIILPEINIWINSEGEPVVSKINRESPGRFLVSELMIMGNWLMARFLQQHKIPAIFRSQAPPRERLFKNHEGTLYQNWMQRKYLNRFHLDSEPEYHSGLGLDAYVTATSPIRKYFDLVTQRQIRSALGLGKSYTKDQIDHLIHSLELTMGTVSRIQYARQRYWLLKHIEKKIGEKTEAVVLYKKRNSYAILLKEYMLECDLATSNGVDLKPEDLVLVKIQHVNARNDMISLYIG